MKTRKKVLPWESGAPGTVPYGKSGPGYYIAFTKRLLEGLEIATFREKNLYLTWVSHLHWLRKIELWGPGPLIVKSLFIIVLHMCVVEMEPVKTFSTRPVNFKIYASRPFSDRPAWQFFFTEGFCSLFNASNKNFQKGERMGEVLKFVTLLACKKLAKNFNFKTFLG